VRDYPRCVKQEGFRRGSGDTVLGSGAPVSYSVGLDCVTDWVRDYPSWREDTKNDREKKESRYVSRQTTAP
jgi:hypothetical protein